MKRIVIRCIANGAYTRRDGHHRWAWVTGLYSTPEHPYRERWCKRCYQYESEVR